MVFMPYYMALGFNGLTVSSIKKRVNGLLLMINFSVTVVENIVLFIINMIT